MNDRETPFTIQAIPPFRLDLTVDVLRRFSTNVVDRIDAQGRYVRLLGGLAGPALVTASQRNATTVDVTVDGPPGEEARARALVARALGVERDLTQFYRRAAKLPWFGAFARRMRGVKPPRYPTLWEACVNAIVFQQISLFAAGAILRRTVESLGERREHNGLTLFAFPEPASIVDARDKILKSAGLSDGKIATLRRVAVALLSAELDEVMLEERETPVAAQILTAIKGIGPWTASIILLRGLGRLDLWPQNDSGAARSLALLSESRSLDLDAALQTLGPWRGMLYYHLLLARLEKRKAVEEP